MSPEPHTAPATPDTTDTDGQARTVGEEVNETVQDMLPWGISFLFHMALVLLALFVVWSATLVMPDEETPVVPKLALTSNTPSLLDVPQIDSPTVTPTAAPPKRPESDPRTPNLDEPQDIPADFGKGLIPNSPRSPIDGQGTTGNASNTIFGPPSGPPGGDANRIVFLVDASGSLIADLPFVVKELKRSIDGLKGEAVVSSRVLPRQRGWPAHRADSPGDGADPGDRGEQAAGDPMAGRTPRTTPPAAALSRCRRSRPRSR